MIVKLMNEQNLKFLSLKRDCTGSTESMLVKMPHFRESHVTALFCFSTRAVKYECK